MDISISLSEPLLVLRQRSDTINTLLVGRRWIALL